MSALLAPAGAVCVLLTFIAAGHGLWYQVSAMRRLRRDPSLDLGDG